jgi:cyanophycin synthetase
MGLDIAGVDFLCPDISRSWRAVGGAVNEVNAQPAFRVHWLGAPERDINAEVLDWLYQNKPCRIPTAAITGTNGKTKVARMLHHIWRVAGKTAGVCTTQGVWVGDEMVSSENLSGFPGARMMMDDPALEVAVIEMPRKGLLVFGHPCDRYDVAALLNVQADHIGVDGIETLDQMAELKAQVLARARQAVVVNADDARCLAMRKRAAPGVRHILVARGGDNPAVLAHRAQGGEAMFLAQVHQESWVVHAAGAAQTPLMRLSAIPATMNGLLRFNETNALFAMALAGAQGVCWDTVCQAMTIFRHSPQANPGRYNFIEGFPFQVMLDYGHNPDGVQEVCRIASQLEVAGQRRLMAAEVGSRHRAHWPAVAPAVAQVFDQLVISCYPDYVAKSRDYAGEDPVANMLNGAHEALLTAGLPAAVVQTQRDRAAALTIALTSSQPGDLLVLLMDPREALPALEHARQALWLRSTQTPTS